MTHLLKRVGGHTRHHLFLLRIHPGIDHREAMMMLIWRWMTLKIHLKEFLWGQHAINVGGMIERVISCLKCGKRGYCDSCISTWYSHTPLEEIEKACPACHGSCNCKACIRGDNMIKVRIQEIPVLDKLQYHYSLLSSMLPVIKKIHQEQCFEVELERKLYKTDIDLPRAKVSADEQMCCNFCRIPFVDYHWRCANCSYDLCLHCCQDLRSASSVGVKDIGNEMGERTRDKETSMGQPSKLKLNFLHKFSGWKANSDSSIPCPPKEYGGCGHHSLNLNRIFKMNWVAKLVKNVEEIVSGCKDLVAIWRGIKETTDEKIKDETIMVKAIDCLDRSEVDIELDQFIKGYIEGRTHENGSSEMLKLKDWPSPSASEEFLMYQRPEFISKLPLLEYIHSRCNCWCMHVKSVEKELGDLSIDGPDMDDESESTFDVHEDQESENTMIAEKSDVLKLTEYLQKHWKDFRKPESAVSDYVMCPLYDQAAYPNKHHKRKLGQEFGRLRNSRQSWRVKEKL
ncbi:hypothetical protein V6N13_019981 [Hibiscus sabdariffa]